MPRFRGESSTNGVGAFIIVLALAVLAIILLEYYGIIDLLPGIGLI